MIPCNGEVYAKFLGNEIVYVPVMCWNEVTLVGMINIRHIQSQPHLSDITEMVDNYGMFIGYVLSSKLHENIDEEYFNAMRLKVEPPVIEVQ